jgi:hypothetical protein
LRSPSPTQICGKFSRKKLVKCSFDRITAVWTPRSRACPRSESSASKKRVRWSSGADSRAADIIGACEAA